jgi:hypothetical protein
MSVKHYTHPLVVSYRGRLKAKYPEVWADVRGYEGLYQVSTYGRVKSLDRAVRCNGGFRLVKEQTLKPLPHDDGRYLQVGLSREYKVTHHFIHRLVAQAFIPNPHNKPEVNHKDLNGCNNYISNLEWMTRKENIKHAMKNGRGPCGPKGSKSTWAKLTESQVRDILRRVAAGERTCEVARRYDVSDSTVSTIKMRQAWKHVHV